MAYLAAGLMLLLSILGLVHAYVTPKDQGLRGPRPDPCRRVDPRQGVISPRLRQRRGPQASGGSRRCR